MGKFCEICEKGTLNGNNVSHSNRKTHRTWAPNVQSVRVVVNGSAKRMNVCTRCLRLCCARLAYWSPAEQLGRCPKPHQRRRLWTPQGAIAP